MGLVDARPPDPRLSPELYEELRYLWQELLRVAAPSAVYLQPQAGPPVDATAGTVYYDATLAKHRGFDGTTWHNLY